MVLKVKPVPRVETVPMVKLESKVIPVYEVKPGVLDQRVTKEKLGLLEFKVTKVTQELLVQLEKLELQDLPVRIGNEFKIFLYI